MVPEYLNEEIDILDDSVLEICEKLAYKAHDGTYVEGLWDASPSTMMSMIPKPPGWQPMELRTHASDISHSYDPEVSDVQEYCKVSGLNPFYGYTSEPPIAPAFREEKPVGLATPALQALGVMQALLENDDKAHEIPELNTFFCQMWGVSKATVQAARFLKPTLEGRSDIDLIKATRSKSHRIYGYENEQNYVSISGGGYTNAALNEKRYIDWHRISLILRFIGTNLLVSDKTGRARLWSRNETLYYGLVAREFPMVTHSPHCPSLKNLPVDPPKLMLSDALAYAVNYYSSDRILEAVADRNRIASDKIALGANFEVSEITVATVRAALAKDRKAIQLDFSVKPAAPYDIARPDQVKFGRTVEARLGKLDVHHAVSVYRAAELVLLSKLALVWKSPKAAVVRTNLDLLRAPTQLPEAVRRKITLDISDLFGPTGGGMVWRVLKKFRQDLDQAEIDFVRFCLDMHDSNTVTTLGSKSQFWWAASRCHSAFARMTSLLKGAHGKVIHLYNVPNLPLFPQTASIETEHEFLSIMAHLWTKKRDYWVGHYRQRKTQWAEWVEEHPNALSHLSSTKRVQLVRYQWLSKWLPRYTASVTAELEVWPVIPPMFALEFLEETANNFARKRKIANLGPLAHEHYKNYARRLDSLLKPPVKFLTMVEEMHKTAREMSRDLATVLKRLTEPRELHHDPLGALWQEEIDKAAMLEVDFGRQAENLVTPTDMNGMDLENVFRNGAVTTISAESYRARSFVNPTRPTTPMESPKVATPEAPTIDLGDGEDADLDDLDDFDFDEASGGTSVAVASLFTDTVVTGLDRRSPFAEAMDKWGKVPDLNAWAGKAGVQVADLQSCSAQQFKEIMEVAVSLFRAKGEVVEGYDVL